MRGALCPGGRRAWSGGILASAGVLGGRAYQDGIKTPAAEAAGGLGAVDKPGSVRRLG